MNGTNKGQRLTISRDPMSVGRDPSCSISLQDDPETALRHCLIEHTRKDELIIRDAGSMNKVLINNHEVTESKLKHGDIIEIGRTRLLVQAFVQADINQNGAKPKRRNHRRAVTRALILCILAASSIALYYNISNSLKSDATEIENHVLIPPAIFRDLKTAEPAAKPQQNSENAKEPAIEPGDTQAASDKNTAPENVSIPENKATPAPVTVLPAPDKTTPPIVKTPPPEDTPPPVIITDLRLQKFPQKPDYDEMRVASVTLKTTGKKIQDSKVSVQFEFFDRILTTDEITSARAIVPLKPASTTLLAANGEETLSAAYTVPKGLRSSRADKSAYIFYGVRVIVMYDGDIVAQIATPVTLIQED